MRATITAMAAMMAAVALADVVPTVQWDVETGRLVPVPYTLSIRRGESANLQPRFLSYNSAMVLTGATVQLRYWYTGQSGYYATTGSLMAATGRVHIAWYDALCPASNALNYEVRCTAGTSVLARAYGPLSLLTGTSGTETNGQVRTQINWSLVDQIGGPAVLSNHMGSGATWSGTQWTFAGGSSGASYADLTATSGADRAYAAGLTNGFVGTGYVAAVSYPASNPSNYVTKSITNGLGGISADAVTNTLNLSISPSLTNTVGLAAGALQEIELGRIGQITTLTDTNTLVVSGVGSGFDGEYTLETTGPWALSIVGVNAIISYSRGGINHIAVDTLSVANAITNWELRPRVNTPGTAIPPGTTAATNHQYWYGTLYYPPGDPRHGAVMTNGWSGVNYYDSPTIRYRTYDVTNWVGQQGTTIIISDGKLDGVHSGDGSPLTGITAAQVGASPTGHVHDAAAVTNLPASPTLASLGGMTNTPAGITAAGGVTGTIYYAGTTTFASNGLAYIGTNNFSGGGSGGGVTNHTDLQNLNSDTGNVHVTSAEQGRIPPAYTNPSLRAVYYHNGTNGYWTPVYQSYAAGLTTVWTHSTNFNYIGVATQLFIIPAGVQQVRVKAWGAGGGGSSSVGLGAVGGFASTVLNFSGSGGETVSVVVAQGGIGTNSASPFRGPTPGGWPGGGWGAYMQTNQTFWGGSGGGVTYLLTNGVLVVAAAGGGGGSQYNNSSGRDGASGGGATGASGTASSGTPPTGGTQNAGGLGGSGLTYPGSAGSYLRGGDAYTNATGLNSTAGGGGAGYYGGGGGACANAQQQSGAGGSCYVSTSDPYGYIQRGNNTDDSDYIAGIGTAGVIGGNGGNGTVKLDWYYTTP